MTSLDTYIHNSDISQPRIVLNRTLYFDESNNIKKAIIGRDKDNVPDLENLFFVLGGIAINEKLDFDDLLKYCGARQKPVDAKFKFFSFKHSKFLEAIAQPRLRKFFEYLLLKKVVIHYSVLDYLHFALNDILDSLIKKRDEYQELAFSFYLTFQSDVTEVLLRDFPKLHEILLKYEFPNISSNKSSSFINEILSLYSKNMSYFDLRNPENDSKVLLEKLIEAKKGESPLIFLQGNSPFVIFDSIFHIYLFRMTTFKDKKFFDNEKDISCALNDMDSDYRKKLNIEFLDSKDNREIQLCDVICGFNSRLYNFLSKTTNDGIIDFCKKLDKNSESYKTLKLFFSLVDYSIDVSPIYVHHYTPIFIERRWMTMYHLIMD